MVLDSGNSEEDVHYLEKPFTAEQLALKVREALAATKRPARESAGQVERTLPSGLETILEECVLYVTLLQNAAVLVALSTLYGLLARLRRDEKAVVIRVLTGLLFGAVAIVGMLVPFRYQTGIIYDGRSIVLAMAGLFGGGIGSAVAILVAGVYRALVGGAGVWAGLATIIACPLLGLAFRRLCGHRPEKIGILPLYGLGISAHAAMLACQMLLPWSRFVDVIGRIWLPVMVVFPVATLVIGLLLRTEERRIWVAHELAQSNDRLDRLASRLNALVWTASADGKTVRDVNQAVQSIYGISVRRVAGQRHSLAGESASR